ncbi:outer membrane receptor protein involved in Fe transport [Neolewinella xylanilytica]|uniref:Outer membrane receptor protein involved in Fe transport n=1 Tax=Neolewinella xylanilytica TaxID=1514080 RepID=A0A2S6I8N7_9BACT|nr:TonB-dependent receptor [Neolewinella xylanilytica]PPK87842.1 outer membrane receptor protein involved in Fe transport [Neolewinella xylanilytica]
MPFTLPSFVIALLLLQVPLFGQSETTGRLSGGVFDADNEPLTGVVVSLNPGNHQTLTDLSGTFSFPELTPGSYVVQAYLLGHKPLRKAVAVAAGAQDLRLVLEADAMLLEEISVVGQSVTTALETEGFAMRALELEEEENSSVQVTDLLDRTSGIRIQQNGGMGSRINYNINGLSGNAIRIFIDGIPMESYGPSFSLQSLPASMIERIEVYKGVVPVELAGDALGGAINVVLKKTLERNALRASYSYGSFNTHQSAVSGNFYDPKSGFTVNGSAFYNASDNDYEVWGNQVYTTDPTTGDITYVRARRFHDRYRSGGFNARAGITNRSWADELLVGGVYSSLDQQIQHGATMESVYGSRKAYQQTQLVNLSYKDNSFLSDKLSLSAFSSYSNLDRRIVDTAAYIYDWDGQRKEKLDANDNVIGYYEYISGAEAGTPTLQTSNERVYVGRATAGYRISERHDLTANVLHTYFTRDSEDPLRHVDIRDLEDTRFSSRSIVGLGYAYRSTDNRLKLSAFYKYFNQGVRIVEYRKESATAEVELNRVNRSVRADGFGVTAAYEVFPNVLVQTSAERSFRLPVPQELFGNLAENLEPNYGLQPERSKNLNLGVTLGTYRFGNHETRFQVNAFIRDTEDKIKRNVREDDTDETTEFINDDSYISKGFDADLFYSFAGKLDITSSVSVFNSLFNTPFDEDGLAYDWYRDRERNAPFFTANGNVRYRKQDLIQKGSRASVSANVGYVHWFYRDWESLGGRGKDIIPTQLVCDVGLLYTFPGERITLALDGRNIFDRQVFDNYALQKPGRAFYAKINFTIL